MISEAPLPPNLQNWTKSLSFHDSGFAGQLSFGHGIFSSVIGFVDNSETNFCL